MAIDDQVLGVAALEALDRSRFPALIFDDASQLILAPTGTAMKLLDPVGQSVVGRRFDDFTADGPTSAGSMFESGKLTGYEAERLIRQPGGKLLKVTVWVHRYESAAAPRFVVMMIVASDTKPSGAIHKPLPETPAVVGSVDESLLVERISNDTAALFGSPPADLVGRSLISLVIERDRPSCLTALAQAIGSEHGVALYVHSNPGGGSSRTDFSVGCHLLILPLRPSPSSAFVFVPTLAASSPPDALVDMHELIGRLNRGVEVALLARSLERGLTEANLPGLGHLTTRELEITTRLSGGSRVPAIAKSLFLSQSTVRSHLGSIFFKLGVADQQQLLDAVRATRSAEIVPRAT
jgi:DNA-binding CsgD family transcriptional regulator